MNLNGQYKGTDKIMFLYLYLSKEKIEQIKNKCNVTGIDYLDFCQKFTADHAPMTPFLTARDSYTYVNTQADIFIGATNGLQ